MGVKVTISVSMDSENDADLMRWLEAQENQSAAVRMCIRHHISGGITLGDLYQAIQDMKRDMVTAGASVNVSAKAEGEEDPEVAAALDALANL